MKAADIMIRNVRTVTSDTNMEQLFECFRKRTCSGFPVVNEDGVLIGIITENDLSKYLEKYLPPSFSSFNTIINIGPGQSPTSNVLNIEDTTVGSIMTKKVYTAVADTPISSIARLMMDKNINHVPVVDENNRVIGIISRNDIIKSLAKN
jgi:CBS domain-containing protein